MDLKSAIKKVNARGALLVFPLQNRKEPPSLWSEFYPRSKMKWEWDDGGDSRVADLWHLQEELSRSGKVVYTKWYRGRATLFSKTVFQALLSLTRAAISRDTLSHDALTVLEELEDNSPLSTKALKRATDLVGRDFERDYQRALKELWTNLLIVGFGEVDDGAFPSLAVGATEVIFEDLWKGSEGIRREDALTILEKNLGKESLFFKELHSAESKKRTRERGSWLPPHPDDTRR